MRFPLDEKTQLLAVRGVGPKVVERLEQMGFHSLAQLADADARDILAQGTLLTGSSCWKNSPQAQAAVQAAIGAALVASTPGAAPGEAGVELSSILRKASASASPASPASPKNLAPNAP